MNSWLFQDSILEASWPFPSWVYVVVGIAIFGSAYYSYQVQLTASAIDPSKKPKGRAALLAGLRTFSCLLLVFMLAGWSVQPFATEHPELFLVFDQSMSTGTIDERESGAKDPKGKAYETSVSRLEQAKSTFSEAMLQRLSDRFHLRIFSMGSQLVELNRHEGMVREEIQRLQSDQNSSRIGNAIRDAVLLARGQAVDGIVLLTDGVNTDGLAIHEAALMARERRVPLYFLGLGNRMRHPDLRLRDVLVDPIVFLGDTVMMQVLVERHDIASATCTVRLRDASTREILDEQTIPFPEKENEVAAQLHWKADQAGRKNLLLELQSEEAEKDISNNSASRSIEVRDAAIPVLLVGGSPSFEYRFLKHLLERTRQTGAPTQPAFAVQVVLEQADPDYVLQDANSIQVLPATDAALQQFDAIILTDTSPSLLTRPFQLALNRYVTEFGGGLMIVCGPEHMPLGYRDTELAKLIPIDLAKTDMAKMKAEGGGRPFDWKMNRELPSIPPLRLEASSEANDKLWGQLPKQSWRLRGIVPKPVSQVFAFAEEEGNAADPVLVGEYVGAGRVVLQGTDESFQWQSYFGDDVYYQRYWTQMVRWLSRNRSLNQQEQANLEIDGKRYRAGQEVIATLRFGGKSLQPSRLKLIRSGMEDRWFPLDRVPDSPMTYRAIMRDLEPGSYRVEWPAEDQSVVPWQEFEVATVPGELANLDPDEAAMKEGAKISRGKYFAWKDVAELEKSLPNSGLVRLQPLAKIPVWNHPLVIACLVTLLACEWFMRRKFGLA